MPTFLTCYAYGQGGVWLLLEADTHGVAQAAYPGLTVLESRPDWMSEADEVEYRARCESIGFRWSASSPPTGWLKSYVDSEALQS